MAHILVHGLAGTTSAFFLGLTTKNVIVPKLLGGLSVLNLIYPWGCEKVPKWYRPSINTIFPLFYLIGLKFWVIGLTGGIATGKSTVSNILRKNKFVIVDADKISHDLRMFNTAYQKSLRQEFGETIWNKSLNQIDSAKLGEIIFSDPEKR